MTVNQASRERPLTLAFDREFTRLFRLMSPAGKNGRFKTGPYTLTWDNREAWLKIDGDLIAYMGNGRQYGSERKLQGAIIELGKGVNKGLSKGLAVKAKSASTRLATLMDGVYEEYPEAGYSVATDKLLILKDVNQVESPDNVLFEIPLTGAVRSIV